jgi:hypothetical protein
MLMMHHDPIANTTTLNATQPDMASPCNDERAVCNARPIIDTSQDQAATAATTTTATTRESKKTTLELHLVHSERTT